MNRRAFVTGLGAVLTVPLAAEAQQAGKVPTVGWVEAGSRSANQHFLDAFRQALRDLKYVEGQDIVIEDRWAGGQEDQFSKLIAELIRLKVDLVVVASTSGAAAAKSTVRTTPVVFWGVSDPVGIGVVSSLAHPGGNITGVSLGLEDGLAGKWLELMREAVPNSSRIAVLWNPNARGPLERVNDLRMAAANPEGRASHIRGAQRERFRRRLQRHVENPCRRVNRGDGPFDASPSRTHRATRGADSAASNLWFL